jgi:hypothetical protein
VTILAEVLDPDGRRVELTNEGWQHVIDGHPELAPLQADVMRGVHAPSRRLGGRDPAEEWFYLAGVGPSRWIKMVVVFEGDTGRIITAFPRRAFP